MKTANRFEKTKLQHQLILTESYLVFQIYIFYFDLLVSFI